MAANGSEKVFCVLTFHGCRVSYNCPAAIPHQTRERTTIRQLHSKVVCSFKRQGVCVKETIAAYMLQTVWNELDYRVNVCRITKGAHREHL